MNIDFIQELCSKNNLKFVKSEWTDMPRKTLKIYSNDPMFYTPIAKTKLRKNHLFVS